MSASGYENMLEKYRDVDEDEIMSGLSKDELARLENEIDREILEKPPDLEESDAYTTATTTSDDSDSDRCDEEPKPTPQKIREPEEVHREPSTHAKGIPEAFAKGKLDKTQLRPVQKILTKQKSKDKHTFKLPTLKKTACNRNDAEDSNTELKDELIQAVKKRDKRRTRRGNSSGVTVRRPSCGISKARRNSKVTRHRDGNEHQVDDFVNRNFITSEMLNLRPKLKKVQIKEPKLVLPDELHGVSFNRITAGAKRKQEMEELDEDMEDIDPEPAISEDGDASRSSAFGYDADNDVTPSLSDESYALPGEDCEMEEEKQGRKKAMSESSEAPSDGVARASTTSTSAESCDVFGELSINPNSVEEMIERVRDDDPMLTEVNLNNIHEVPIERFEELAEAMKENTRVTSLLLANTGLTDRAAKAIASMLKRNKTLKKLNIESNFITGDGARRIVSALRKNNCLTELCLDNQRHIFGAKVEMEMSKLLRDNTSLLKFGYQFANPGPRMATSSILTKNTDLVRRKRVAEEKKRREAGGSKRPPLRRQPSSEWYRKERLERLKKFQEQAKNLQYDDKGNIKQGEVEKVLKNMNPDEVALLERWFTSKLLGIVDSPPVDKQEEKHPKKSQSAEIPSKTELRKPEPKPNKQDKADDNLLRPPARVKRSKSPVASRDDLMDSIRKQSTKLKKVKLRPFESPSRLGNTDSDVEIRSLPNDKKKNSSTTKEKNTVGTKSESTRKTDEKASVTNQKPDRDSVQEDSGAKDTQFKLENRGRQMTCEKEPTRTDRPNNQTPSNKFVTTISPQREEAKNEVNVVKPTITRTEPSFDEGSEIHHIKKGIPEPDKKVISSNESEGSSTKTDEDNRLSSSSPEVREWKEGEEYDSDEYEVVEIEVTDSEEGDSGDNDKLASKQEEKIEIKQSPSGRSVPSPSRDRQTVSPNLKHTSADRYAHSRPPPFSEFDTRNRQSKLSTPDALDKRSHAKSNSPLLRSTSPAMSSRSNPRTPLSPNTPRSTHSFGSPSYTRSLSRNSNTSADGTSGTTSPRFARPTPPRSSRPTRSRQTEDEAPICPKALSTIESFFKF